MAIYLQTQIAHLKTDNMTNMKRSILTSCLILALVPTAKAQQVLSLEDCRQMAIAQSKELDQSRIQMEMAGYDRKIALANYFPKVSATGAYIYNNRDVSLVSDSQSARLQTMGTTLENSIWDALNNRVDEALTNEYARELGHKLLESARANGGFDIASPVNAIGQEIDKSLHPDLHNIWVGTVVVEQPLYVGGKIVYSNQMAALAEQLAQSKYDMKEAEVILDVDQAYWQIISISNKKKLAESYADLLHHMEKDVKTAIATGVATEADALQVKVKANEADMMLAKASNGLMLSKMLLCHRVGLPLESEIQLADEYLEVIPEPAVGDAKSLEDIYADRPETRSLELAEKIFDKKAKVVRADYLPTVALMGAYTVTNPNLYNGFQNSWQGGNLSAGVVVKVPIFHGGEGVFKYRKAQAEARQYADQLDDARELIDLQVTQQRKLLDEARQKLQMAESNLESAEENLRMATIGHDAGVIPTNTVLGAQTAWLSAHSDYIDAGIELQMAAANLNKAEGNK